MIAWEAPLSDGIHRMGGIAQQRYPAEVPRRQRIAVDHRILVNGCGAADEGRGIEKIEDERRERLEHILEAGGMVLVLCRHRLLGSVLELGHRVDERLALRFMPP